MRNKKILIVDDDIFIRRMVEEAFLQEKAKIITAANGHEGLQKFFAERPELVILDVVMPYVDGWEALRQIRNLSNTPVIMLTSLKDDADIVRGLEDGAIDFVTKPFSPKVLVARARAAIRQTNTTIQPTRPAGFQDQYLHIDLENHRILVNDDPVKLTKTEFKLLAYLVKHPGMVLTFEKILENVWGWEYQDSIQYVHVYMSRLRQKLEPDPKEPRYFLTEFGVGYRFDKQS
ncbi:MAG: DNA-binding response regulator [Chloroflexi bacterium]|nr:MAG: DNA-binding response regulator [Chloroflexota bacterium]